MTDKNNQNQNSADDSKAKNPLDYSLEEVAKMTPEEQEKLFMGDKSKEESEEQSDKDSNESQDEVSEESEETSEEDSEEQEEDESSEDSESDEKDKQNEDKFDYKKAYKELQSEFTKRNQATKKLMERLSELEGKSNKPEKSDEALDELAQLKEKNPEAKIFIEALEKAIEKRVEKRVKQVEEQVSSRTSTENQNVFVSQLDTFLKGDLKGLKSELTTIINEQYETREELLEAAKSNPNLFKEFEKELFYRHPDKVHEFRSKKSKVTPAEKNKQVNKTGVIKKSNTSEEAQSVEDHDKFKKLPLKDMENQLRKMGAFK